MNSIQKLQSLGQEIWLDYISRGLIKSGGLKKLVDSGVTGLTANPTILEKAILGGSDYDEEISALSRANKRPEEIYETLAIEDIHASAELFRPTFDKTRGEWGYASLEINPLIAYGTQKTIKEGRRLFAALNRPNVMVKVPATPEGIPAIRQLTGEGVNVNITLIFSLDVYQEVIEAYLSGLEDFSKKGGDLKKVASVASFFLSRIDTLVDNLLAERIRQGEKQLESLLGTSAIASAKLAYKIFTESFSGKRFATLKARGARVQRPLWASTSTKNPRYSDVKYVEPLIGPDTVNTMPESTIKAFLDHGRAERTIEQGTDEARQNLDDLQTAGIDMKSVTDKLLSDGVKSFSDDFKKLMTGIGEKKSRMSALQNTYPAIGR